MPVRLSDTGTTKSMKEPRSLGIGPRTGDPTLPAPSATGSLTGRGIPISPPAVERTSGTLLINMRNVANLGPDSQSGLRLNTQKVPCSFANWLTAILRIGMSVEIWPPGYPPWVPGLLALLRPLRTPLGPLDPSSSPI
jgi:hypothetical protein